MKILYIIPLLGLLSCSKKATILDEYKGDKIIFGNGGGFSGATTSIMLLENGEIYRVGSNENDFKLMGQLKKNVTKNQFMTYETMGLKKIDLNEPGNRYFFISKIVDGKEHKILWGKNKLENNIPKLYYDNMMSLAEAVESKTKEK